MGELNFRVPLDGYDYISSPYGNRVHPITKKEKFHSGIDYAVKYKPVMASESGKVIRASKHESLGELIIIDHTPGAYEGGKHIYTMYGHLRKYAVQLGEVVKKGQVIGLSGNTGRSTGPHLHFSIVESNGKLSWGATGSTGYDPTPTLFKNPKDYYGRTITIKGTIYDFTGEDMDKFYAMITTDFRTTPRPIFMVGIPEYREVIKKLRGEYPSIDEKPPKVTLKFKNMFSSAFRP